jgi:two-component system nitrate/nitrite response regulator NarL
MALTNGYTECILLAFLDQSWGRASVVRTRHGAANPLKIRVQQSGSAVCTEGSIRVLPVAEVRLYREGLARSLGGRKNLEVVATAANRDEALTLVESMQPDVVVLDMATSDSLEIVRSIGRSAPKVRTLAFALEEIDRAILASAEAGVAGYVPCDASVDDLVAAIESVMRGELLCRPRTAALLLERLASLARGGHAQSQGLNLTGREREIVVLIDQGLSNKEIAQQLNIEVATVKNHVHNLLEKLHVNTRAQAAAHFRIGTGRAVRSVTTDGT